jgi:DNA-binding transcriptional LysR family regulator
MTRQDSRYLYSEVVDDLRVSPTTTEMLLVKNLDIRVLAVLRELQRTANVSHAAQNLGLSQSAVSMSLARLRRHFNDPLFVRTSRGMEPTPYAEGLFVELKEASKRLESALGPSPQV